MDTGTAIHYSLRSLSPPHLDIEVLQYLYTSAVHFTFLICHPPLVVTPIPHLTYIYTKPAAIDRQSLSFTQILGLIALQLIRMFHVG